MVIFFLNKVLSKHTFWIGNVRPSNGIADIIVWHCHYRWQFNIFVEGPIGTFATDLRHRKLDLLKPLLVQSMTNRGLNK